MIIMGDKYTITSKPKARKSWAKTDIVGRTIQLAAALKGTAYRDVLGHEIVHVFLTNSGLDGFLTPEQLESLCDTIGRNMMQMIEDNYEPRKEK